MKTLMAILMGLIVSTAGLAQAQLWSSVLDPSRATDWTKAGVTGVAVNSTSGLPNYTVQCGATLTPAGPPVTTSDVINTAIYNCHLTVAASGGTIAGAFVKLGPGHYPMTKSISWRTAGLGGATGVSAQRVVLRGSGPDQTFLEWTADPIKDALTPCPFGAGLVCISDRQWAAGQCSHATPAAWNSGDWTGSNGIPGSYAAGGSTITLENVVMLSGIPLTVGTYLFLDQKDQPTASYTAYRPFSSSVSPYVNKIGANPLPCSSARFQSPPSENTRCVIEWHRITNVTGSGSGPYTVTIDPPINYTYWNADGINQPQAIWCHTAASQILGDGIEDLTIDNQFSGNAGRGLIRMSGAFQSWVKNVSARQAAGAYVMIFGGANIEIRDSYFYQITTPNFCSSPSGTVTYGIDPISAGQLRVENDIFHQTCKPLMAQACFVCVFGYNYTVGTLLQIDEQAPFAKHLAAAASPNHVAGTHMLLFEGNDINGLNQDHATGHGAGAGLLTAFRNRITGYQPIDSRDGTSLPVVNASFKTPVVSAAMNRFSSYIGNVLGHPVLVSLGWDYQVFKTDDVPSTPSTSGYDGHMFSFGFSGNADSLSDPVQKISAMRWGNFDVVTNNARWCGNSFNTGWVSRCSSTTEIPAGNAIPATEILPASFYLNSRPSWYSASLAWPAIGPDVTGGADPQDTSGHTKRIPAKQCFLGVMGGNIDGTGPVLPFNANTCYGSTDTLPPAAPTGITVSKLEY